MAWVAVAIGGAAIVGAWSANNAAESAANASDRATNAADAASAAQLAFQQQQYDDWQAVYGPIQDNLSSFYQKLTPETFAASGLQQAQQQYNATQEQFQRSFAQRGITTGAQAMMEQQAALSLAQEKAGIRQQAPMQVATAQQGFLNQQVNNPATTGISNALQNQTNLFGQQAATYNQQATQAYNVMGQNIQQGFQAYGQYQQNQALQNQAIQAQTASMYGTTAGSAQTSMLATQNAGLIS